MTRFGLIRVEPSEITHELGQLRDPAEDAELAAMASRWRLGSIEEK